MAGWNWSNYGDTLVNIYYWTIWESVLSCGLKTTWSELIFFCAFWLLSRVELFAQTLAQVLVYRRFVPTADIDGCLLAVFVLEFHDRRRSANMRDFEVWILFRVWIDEISDVGKSSKFSVTYYELSALEYRYWFWYIGCIFEATRHTRRFKLFWKTELFHILANWTGQSLRVEP